jgi:hypothetical protein
MVSSKISKIVLKLLHPYNFKNPDNFEICPLDFKMPLYIYFKSLMDFSLLINKNKNNNKKNNIYTYSCIKKYTTVIKRVSNNS